MILTPYDNNQLLRIQVPASKTIERTVGPVTYINGRDEVAAGADPLASILAPICALGACYTDYEKLDQFRSEFFKVFAGQNQILATLVAVQLIARQYHGLAIRAEKYAQMTD